MYKFIVSDIDGTFIKRKNIVPKINKIAVAKLREKGCHFVLATGRRIESTIKVAEQVGCKEFLDFGISFNGGVIWQFTPDGGYQIIEKYTIPNNIVKEIFAFSKKIGLQLFAYSTNNKLVSTKRMNIKTWLFKKHIKLELERYKESEFNEDVYKIISIGSTKKVKLMNELSKKYNLSIFNLSYTSSNQYFEISPENVNKAEALKLIADITSSQSDDFVFFGDSSNDIEALKWVGHPVAMANSRKNIKKLTSNITKYSNKKGGFGKYVINKIISE